ncbi:MAG: hypothetical protein KGI08_00250 [Thaumarchaeota archaeon]|nr:hypothetical protein [Nitrososphaerota archaeon]
MKKPRCDEIDQNLKDFINNIYLKNNKEMARLAESVEGLSVRLSDYIRSSEEYKKIREEKEAPMMAWFDGMSFLRRFILGLTAFGTSILGLYLLAKKLLE